MLELVLANGNIFRIIEQDVGCHEYGIIKDTDIDTLLPFALILKLCHAIKIAHASDTIEYPAELGMGRDMGLTVKMHMLVKTQAGRKVVFEGLDDILLELAINFGNDRVQVWNKDIDMGGLAMLVGEANHGYKGTKKIAKS